ncbi:MULTISPECIES: AEC family transporter [unclassified Butyrivibrio]|uniref:AEC family transporter n=1 Tax=unclassified Butyrivibrio TaxID=2639466 RepID=UPI0003F551E8|nr:MULTISPECIES: AEC family transporter [unclassified Butyrivibrio]
MVQTIFFQICTMFLLALCGYCLYKAGKITDEGSKTIGNILIYLSLPCVIMRSFFRERTEGELTLLIVAAALSFLALCISTIVSRLIFRKDKVAVFAGAYSNPGFFGVPIITASLGADAVFFVAPFIGFLNMFQWTYGVSLLKGGNKIEKITLKQIVTAPFFIAIIIGLFFYLSGITLPSFVLKSINHIAELNTPLAMFTTGIYLAQTDLLKMLKKPVLYIVSATRLVIIPLVIMLILILIPERFASEAMKMAIFIATACPVGSNVAVYAHLYNADKSYAAETVVISTLLSIITIPFVIYIFGLFA